MKFDTHDYWRHDRNVDCFFRVRHVSFDDDNRNAILHGTWMIQGTGQWWCASDGERIKVTPKQYEHWKPYKPRGKQKLYL